MHVIAKPALIEFWMKHADEENSLQAWYRTMESEVFTDFNNLRATFANADYVDGLTVFNIRGNKYRLVAAIHTIGKKCIFVRYSPMKNTIVTDGNGGNDGLCTQGGA